MDAISYSLADKQAKRIKKFIENPDSNSGIVTVPKVIGAGESVTIPAGRVAVLPNVQVDGTLNVEGEVFVPSGATFGDLESQIALKQDKELTTIASGTATFNSITNNINLTGIGIGIEIGDVIQISGADDTKNNSEFTVEVITDNNNIIVNQAHANKGTSKNVANRIGDTGVTVTLLAKYYNAPLGLGQGWLNLTVSRAAETVYTNNTNRSIHVKANCSVSAPGNLWCWITNGLVSTYASSTSESHLNYAEIIVLKNQTYRTGSTTSMFSWFELR